MNPTLRVVLAALLLGTAVSAGAADGLYIGAGAGIATVRGEINADKLDADDVAYKGFAGWRFNSLPLIDLALEAAYTDFGRPHQTVGGADVRYRLHGGSFAGLLIVPLGPLDVYGKGGAISWRSETTNAGVTTTRSGTDGFYGAGVGVYFWKIGLRAEWERFQIKGVDRVDLVTLSALFQF
jgi:hypothetical protein